VIRVVWNQRTSDPVRGCASRADAGWQESLQNKQMNTNQAKVPATILLVEDDPKIRELMKRFLEELGYAVALATDEDDSLRLMDGDEPKVQLILLNQKMLSDDALAAGRRIREHVNVPNSAPVIVLPFEFKPEFEGKDENMGGRDYKSYMTSEQQLEDLLSGLLRASAIG
jgi:two-component system, OmpR family, phosphate regulon response regulator OmpR